MESFKNIGSETLKTAAGEQDTQDTGHAHVSTQYTYNTQYRTNVNDARHITVSNKPKHKQTDLELEERTRAVAARHGCRPCTVPGRARENIPRDH